jgi:NTP pyrophosphatase (non-canonical NTP hydrolase)
VADTINNLIAGRQHVIHQYTNINKTRKIRKDMTIEEAQKAVDTWIKTYGVRYFSELTNMACLTEEVGELARVMARTYGDQSFKAGEKANIGEEMADVLWVLLCLANQTGIDLTSELQKSFDKKTGRDATRHLNNSKLK